MKYRAIVKQKGKWWIGWLVDLPGVNAQEKTREKLIDSLKIGVQDMLQTQVHFECDAYMTTIDVEEPEWTLTR
jgi:predicted RNase H-like HicB family nuclease